MQKYYSPKELTDALGRMSILCDTREQDNAHVLAFFDKNKIPHDKRTLKTGDYSALFDDCTLEHRVVIERKGSLNELATNLAADRQRFEDEMIRSKANGIKVFLIVEGGSWKDLYDHKYRSELLPKSFAASLLSWQARYNLTVIFCEKEETGHMIYSTLWYWLRAELSGECSR